MDVSSILDSLSIQYLEDFSSFIHGHGATNSEIVSIAEAGYRTWFGEGLAEAGYRTWFGKDVPKLGDKSTLVFLGWTVIGMAEQDQHDPVLFSFGWLLFRVGLECSCIYE